MRNLPCQFTAELTKSCSNWRANDFVSERLDRVAACIATEDRRFRRAVKELEGRSQVEGRRIGSSPEPRYRVLGHRLPRWVLKRYVISCIPRVSEAGWVVATHRVPGASSPENAQFWSGQVISVGSGALQHHRAVSTEPGLLLHDACK